VKRLVACAGLALAAACSSGSGGGPVVDPPDDIAGEFVLSIVVANDGCDFGAEDVVTAMEVSSVTAATADVSIPDSEGACEIRQFDRDEATLTLVRQAPLSIGVCDLEADIVTTFTFEGDGSFSGAEENVLTQTGGDCSGLSLPCTIELTASGTLCNGCFDCVSAQADGVSSPLGALLAGSGVSRQAVDDRVHRAGVEVREVEHEDRGAVRPHGEQHVEGGM
jgi:hypothetical protein